MRNILFLLGVLFAVVIPTMGQTTPIDNKYPAYYIINNDTVGVIINIKQAQKINNDLELLSLYKKMRVSCDSVIGSYILVVDDYNKKIVLLETKNNKVDSISAEQKDLIDNLNLQIKNYKSGEYINEQEIKLREDLIASQNKQIKKLKIKNRIYSIGSIIIIAAILTLHILVR